MLCIVTVNGVSAILAAMYLMRTYKSTFRYIHQLLRNSLVIKYKQNTSKFDCSGFLLLFKILVLIFLYGPLPIFTYFQNLNHVQIFLEFYLLTEKNVRSTAEHFAASVCSVVLYTGYICVASKII